MVEGTKMAREILTNGQLEIEGIFVLKDWKEENKHLLKRTKPKVFEINAADMAKISSLRSPGQVLIVAKKRRFDLDGESIENDLSLYLDTIQDPGNFGTILRIADWFAVSYVFCSDTCADLFNPKVIQASMGAFLRVRVMKMDLKSLTERLPGIPVFGTVLDGKNLFEESLSKRGIIVIGNESRGISEENISLLTHKISIPCNEKGGAESLNAAVATGIVCSVFRNNPSK